MTGDDYPGGTHQCYSSLCARVLTLEWCVEGSLRGCQLYVLAPPYGVPAGPPSASFSGIWTLSGQIGSGLISRLIMIQAKLKR